MKSEWDASAPHEQHLHSSGRSAYGMRLPCIVGRLHATLNMGRRVIRGDLRPTSPEGVVHIARVVMALSKPYFRELAGRLSGVRAAEYVARRPRRATVTIPHAILCNSTEANSIDMISVLAFIA